MNVDNNKDLICDLVNLRQTSKRRADEITIKGFGAGCHLSAYVETKDLNGIANFIKKATK